jgi:hypothetical protein
MSGSKEVTTLYRIKLACDGIPPSAGPQSAIEIAEEFTQRPWHQNVRCSWDGFSLILTAENDFDENGLALRDEFSDAVVACIHEREYSSNIRILEVMTF